MWHHCRWWNHRHSPLPNRFPEVWLTRITILKNSFIYIENNEHGFKSQWIHDLEDDTNVTVSQQCPSPPPSPSITDVLPMTTIPSMSIKHNVFGRKMLHICHQEPCRVSVASEGSLTRTRCSGPCRAVGMSWICSYCAKKTFQRNKCRTSVSASVIFHPRLSCQICLLQVHAKGVSVFPGCKKKLTLLFLENM